MQAALLMLYMYIHINTLSIVTHYLLCFIPEYSTELSCLVLRPIDMYRAHVPGLLWGCGGGGGEQDNQAAMQWCTVTLRVCQPMCAVHASVFELRCQHMLWYACGVLVRARAVGRYNMCVVCILTVASSSGGTSPQTDASL